MTTNLFQTLMKRRRFLQGSAAAGAAGATLGGLGTLGGLSPVEEARAQPPRGETTITKNVCAQCPARCGIDVYTTDGQVHAIYGDTGNPIANGKLCPKGHLGSYFLYDPDRFKGPMKRTNPAKGRDEDPEFVPISWDEALDMVAERLNNLRDQGESHRFAMFYGRGWGPLTRACRAHSVSCMARPMRLSGIPRCALTARRKPSRRLMVIIPTVPTITAIPTIC